MAFPKMPPVNYIRQLKMFKDGVPRRMRFWLIVMFALFFQFVGGVYLASLSQMVGELGFLSEDVTMGGYCALIGLNIIFPMLFRWKFGLFTRQLFFVSTIVIIICSIFSFYITSPVLIWAVCLIAGYFKMMGMFGCMSTIQLNITPTRNFAVFLPVIYVLVSGAVQLSGLATAYVTYFSNWRMMNLVIVVMMLIIDAVTYFMMKHDHRSGPYLPLQGVDWIGQLLWTAVCVIGTWIFTFGEHYDWWDSQAIWNATFLEIAVLAITIIYSKWKANASFIDLKAFCYRTTWIIMFMLLVMATLQGAAHVLQPIYLSSILHYDALNIVSLNYPELFGVIMGGILVYFVLVRWHWGIKRGLFLTFSLAIYYVMSMYFLCDNATDKESMYLAMFALGASEVMMDTIATYFLSQTIPFNHYFMNIAIIGFVRCGFGTSAAAAFVHRLFSWSSAKQIMVATEDFSMNDIYAMAHGYNVNLLSDLNMHGIVMALKECYGIMIIIGIIMLLFIMMANFSTPISRLLPRVMSVRTWMTRRNAPDPTIS